MKFAAGVPSGIFGMVMKLSRTGMLAPRKQRPSRTPAMQGRYFFICNRSSAFVGQAGAVSSILSALATRIAVPDVLAFHHLCFICEHLWPKLFHPCTHWLAPRAMAVTPTLGRSQNEKLLREGSRRIGEAEFAAGDKVVGRQGRPACQRHHEIGGGQHPILVPGQAVGDV